MARHLKLFGTVLAGLGLAGTAWADFADDFSGYADQAAFEASYTKGAFGAPPNMFFQPDFSEALLLDGTDQMKLSVEHAAFGLVNITRTDADQAFGNGLQLDVSVADLQQPDGLTGIQLSLNDPDGRGIFARIDPLDLSQTFDGKSVDGFTVADVEFRDPANTKIVDTGAFAPVLGAADLTSGLFSLIVTPTTYDVQFDGASLIGGAQAHGVGADPLLDMANEFQAKLELVRVGGAPDGFPDRGRKMMTINSIALTSVPEPATLGVLGAGGLALLRRRG